MQKNRVNAFRIDRANLDGLRAIDPAMAKIAEKTMTEIEARINTFYTSSFVCWGGPMHGQTIEVEHSGQAYGSMEISMSGMSGSYVQKKRQVQDRARGWGMMEVRDSHLEWVGTGLQPSQPEHCANPAENNLRKAEKPARNGFSAFDDLLASIGEEEKETEQKTITKTCHRVGMDSWLEISGVDDFGDTFKSVMANNRTIKTLGRIDYCPRAAIMKNPKNLFHGNGGFFMDDFGNAIACKRTSFTDTSDYVYKKFYEAEMAVFKIGRTTYKVRNKAANIEKFRAGVVKAKKWFADKFISAPAIAEPEPAAPVIDTATTAPAMPTEAQPEPATIEGATMPANTAQDFAQDIPATLAEQAFNGTSFSPEKRGKSARDGYAQDMAQALATLTEQATKGGTLGILPSVFAQYRARQSSAYRAYLASSSRCVSSFIAGPSNFPAARMNKRADIAHKRFNEYYDGGKAAMRRAIKELRPDLRPIMAGDADAVERLQKEIDKAEREQAIMKSANAAIRKYAKAGEAAQVEALMALGLKERLALEAVKPDYAGRVGFPSYALSNNSANIRRMKERLEKIGKAKAQEVTQHDGRDGVTIEDDAPANRVRLFFPGKPCEATRAELKASGFRWAPSIEAWQAYRNDRTMRLARSYLLPTARSLAGAPVASEATEPEAPEAAPISCTNFEQKTEISAPATAPEAVQPEQADNTTQPANVGGGRGAARSNLESEPVAYQWPDVLALTVADVQAMPDSIYAQHLDKLEDINHHAEALMLECLRAGQIVLAQAIAHLVRYQTSPDYRGLTGDYCDARMHISDKLRGRELGTITPEAQALLTAWGLGHWFEAPQPPSAPASPEFAQHMAQARGARHLAREAIARAKESSRATTPLEDDPAHAFPHLLPLTKEERHKGGTGAAPNIRRHLKKQFPGVKFSVASDYSQVNVRWTDGPATEDVDAALAGFEIGRSDCMTDYFYTETTRFSERFGGVQYLFTNRAMSDDLLARALLDVFGPNGPSVTDFRKSKAWGQVQQGTHKGRQMSQYEWMSLAEKHARKI